jgi:DNA polymerase-3 subunit gamma/tau
MASSYQVLARKWRPQQFDEVVGQDHITQTLVNAIEQNRLAHAYLFVGPRGIGKTSMARVFAKALNCVKGPTPKPCDKCDSCKEIAAGTSLDVLEIDGASNNSVDQIRDLRDNVRYAPARGKFKIYIIDEVHMLSTAAFNALLKTLEEPPAHVKFIFATTEPQKVLPTILSRCQRFDLRRIPAALIAKRLKEIARDEKVSIDDKALAAIARGAEGGLRDAESALDQLIAFCGEKITETDVLSVFGLVAHDKISALTDAILDGKTRDALKIVQELDENGKDLQRLLTDLLDHFRNLLVTIVGGAEMADITEAELALLKNQAERADADTVLRILDALSAAEGRLRYALSKRIFTEIAVLKAIKSREGIGIDALIKKLSELKGKSPAPAPQKAEKKSEPAAVAPAPEPEIAADLAEIWAFVLDRVSKASPFLRQYLLEASPISLENGTLTIGFGAQDAAHKEFVDNAKNISLIQSKLKEKLRRDVTVKFVVTQEIVANVEPTAPKPETKTGFENDPLIQKALEIFKGTVVEVRQ